MLLRRLLPIALVTPVMCTPFKDDPQPDPALAGVEAEAGLPCDPQAPFVRTTPVPGLASIATSVAGLRLSPDYKTAYFNASDRSDSVGNNDLYTATRAAPDSEFGAIQPIVGDGINTIYEESDPSITGDGLALVFA